MIAPRPSSITPPAQAPVAAPRAPAAPPAPRTPAPQQVVTVVHRLRGWKLLKRLAANPGNMVSVVELPGASDVHTNIVAGYVSEDGRTVMARLPQAEAEVEAAAAGTLPPGFPGQSFGPASEASDLTLVRNDGVSFKAKFIGLDSSTGLSLLEATEPLLPPQAPPPTPDEGTPVGEIGQHLRLYAPTPAGHTPSAYTPGAAPPAETAPPAGVIYLNMSETGARLTEIKRASTGRPFQVTARTNRYSPAWTGAVVTNDKGALFGIVAECGLTEARIVPVEVIRGAAERVLKRRASVPQPWLGALGDAVTSTPLNWFEAKGWDLKRLQPLISRGSGVLLTGVLPGTPADLGGLRPGDVIMSVGEREFRGVEEFGQLLNEAGVGSTVNFKVLRLLESAPLDVSVRLSARQNPARATREAELSAAGAALVAARAAQDAAYASAVAARAKAAALAAEARAERIKARNLRTGSGSADDARRLAEIEKHLSQIMEREAEARAHVLEASNRILEAKRRNTEAEMRLRQAERRIAQLDQQFAAGGGGVVKPLLGYGLETLGLTPRSAASLKAAGGLLVVSVRPESPAAASGLRYGDVIETIDGQRLTAPHWGSGLLQPATGAPADLTLGVVREGRRLTLKLPRK